MQALDRSGSMAESAFRLFRFLPPMSDLSRSGCNRPLGDSCFPAQSRRKVSLAEYILRVRMSLSLS